MKKSIIDTYTTIYFVDIVVANKYATLEELKKIYTYNDGDEIDDRILHGCMTTSTIRRREDNKDCMLIKYNRDCEIKSIDKRIDFINSIAHEAGHAALDIYEHMNQNVCFCSPEPFCYLLGYIAECAYNTLTKKQ